MSSHPWCLLWWRLTGQEFVRRCLSSKVRERQSFQVTCLIVIADIRKGMKSRDIIFNPNDEIYSFYFEVCPNPNNVVFICKSQSLSRSTVARTGHCLPIFWAQDLGQPWTSWIQDAVVLNAWRTLATGQTSETKWETRCTQRRRTRGPKGTVRSAESSCLNFLCTAC